MALTLEQQKQIIDNGGSVLIDGQIYTKHEELPGIAPKKEQTALTAFEQEAADAEARRIEQEQLAAKDEADKAAAVKAAARAAKAGKTAEDPNGGAAGSGDGSRDGSGEESGSGDGNTP